MLNFLNDYYVAALMRRVVITGAGVISPIGNSLDDFTKNLEAGVSGAEKVDTEWIKSQRSVQEAGQEKLVDVFGAKVYARVKDFKPENIGRKTIRTADIYAQYGLEAAYQAIRNAGLELEAFVADEGPGGRKIEIKDKYFAVKNVDPDRVGVMIGTGIGGQETNVQSAISYMGKKYRDISVFSVPKIMANSLSGLVSIQYGLHGPQRSVATACATSTDIMGDAYEKIKLGKEADMIVTGGAEALLGHNGFTYYLFDLITAMSSGFNETPTRASRPFDAKRDGFVMSEGAGVLVMEELEHALARKAPILAEVLGCYSTSDGYSITEPDPNGTQVKRLMRDALAWTKVDPGSIDLINAHGTSTPLNDKAETKSIKDVFGKHAYNLRVNSTKSMLGHSLGASGALEAIATIQALQRGIVHPTINQEFPDPECDLNYVPNKAEVANPKIAMSNSYGFGGPNSTIILAKYAG